MIGPMFPADRLPEHDIQFAAAAPEALPLCFPKLIGIADEPRRGQWIGAQDEIVECGRPLAAVLLPGRAPGASVNIDQAAGQVHIDAEFIVQASQLGGDLPDTAFDEPVVTIEYRTGVHHRQGKGRVRIVERHRTAFGYGHRHVHLAALAREIMVHQVARGSRYP